MKLRWLGCLLVGSLCLYLYLMPSQSSFAQSNQNLSPSPVIINYVETEEDAPFAVRAVELFDGGQGESDLSDLVLVLLDEESGDFQSVSLEGAVTDENGILLVGSVDASDGAFRALPSTSPAATLIGLLHSDQIDGQLPDISSFQDSVVLGWDGTESSARGVPTEAFSTRGTSTLPPPASSSGTTTTPPPAACDEEATRIHEIQGNGAFSPLQGEVVTIQAVVTGDFQDTSRQLRGFFVQEEEEDNDADSTTSEGLFIFDNGFGTDVRTGDLVRVSGQVAEFFSLTELKNVQEIIRCASGSTVEPAVVTLPESIDGELEQVEGMLVRIDNEMTVAQTYFLGRYGQLTLSADGRIYQPTSLFPPASEDWETLADENARRLLVLDDGQDIRALGDNPVPVPYLGTAPPRTVRAGDAVTNLVGVIDFGRINSARGSDTVRDYRLHPVEAPLFTSQNERQSEPDRVEGTLRISSFNVLNYFNGDGDGGGFPTSRGARTLEDFQRQRTKIISAIEALDADIIGLMEIENDGFGPKSAIQDLVNGLNRNASPGSEYAAVDPGLTQLGTDAIAVGLIYRTNAVTPVGDPATLDTGAFDQTLAAGRSRQPLAQTFADENDGKVTVVVNHFKSKRPSDNPTAGNRDAGDGAGAWNERRTEAAQDLLAWLATDPTESGDSDILIIGDLNAYAKESPITTIVGAGYINLLERATGEPAYSFIFDGQSGYLDHALASPSLISQVAGSTEWHINADEPKVIDYDSQFNPPGYFSPDPFRASDHDPLLVGLALASDQPDPTPNRTPTAPAPTAEPPATESPTAEPPATESPTAEPPATESPTAELPVETPTATDPAANTGSDARQADNVLEPQAFGYIVVEGDYLSLLARRFSVTIAALASENNMTIHEPLAVERILKIPAVDLDVACVQTVEASGDERLADIASPLGIQPRNLAILNGLSETGTPAAGQQICIPDIYSGGYYSPSLGLGDLQIQ